MAFDILKKLRIDRVESIDTIRKAIEEIVARINQIIDRVNAGTGGGGGGGGAVDSFNGRTGVVVSVPGDYTPAFIGAVPTSHLAAADPHPQYQREVEKGAASGYAGLNASTVVPPAQLGTGAPSSANFLRGDSSWATLNAGAEVLISEQVVGVGGLTTIVFSSIPSTYRDLRIVIRGRGDTAVNNYCRPRMQFNGDTGGNYTFVRWNAHDSGQEREGSGSLGNTFIDFGVFPSSTGPANFQGSCDARIGNYIGTVFTKPVNYSGGGTAVGELYHITGFGVWNSTSAITDITLLLDNGKYAEGTVASLYGIS